MSLEVPFLKIVRVANFAVKISLAIMNRSAMAIKLMLCSKSKRALFTCIITTIFVHSLDMHPKMG